METPAPAPAPSSTGPPSVGEVDRIAALTDPFLRNLCITHAYHRLSGTFALLLQDAANWCTFATWASRQAGQTIRGEDLPDTFERQLCAAKGPFGVLTNGWRRLLRNALSRPETRRARLLKEAYDPLGAFRRASEAVAAGNMKVFEEIGRAFADFLARCDGHPPTPAQIDAFCATLRPGDPPEGQDYLRGAFTRYGQALTAATAQDRAELVLLANLEIGLHEQTRLQPEIRQALDVPYTEATALGRRLLAVIAPRTQRWTTFVQLPLAGVAGLLGKGAARLTQRLARTAITECFMTLSLPRGRVVHLGRDLTDPFPEALRAPRHPDLVALLARFEPGRGVPDASAACDWSALPERMHYITHLFRSHHEDPLLFDAPFTPVQVERILAGQLPEGDF
jgi:hypothetical protein